jgi:hypothetical protein
LILFSSAELRLACGEPVTFWHESNPLALGRVEALLLKSQSKIKMDYSPHPRLALRAIRCANVRFGILPPQSGLRRNDEPKNQPKADTIPTQPSP